MKTRNKMILAGLAAAAVAGLLIYSARHHKKSKGMLSKVSDEGYETAHDVLFPSRRKKTDKLKYGPVLPD